MGSLFCYCNCKTSGGELYHDVFFYVVNILNYLRNLDDLHHLLDFSINIFKIWSPVRQNYKFISIISLYLFQVCSCFFPHFWLKFCLCCTCSTVSVLFGLGNTSMKEPATFYFVRCYTLTLLMTRGSYICLSIVLEETWVLSFLQALINIFLLEMQCMIVLFVIYHFYF